LGGKPVKRVDLDALIDDLLDHRREEKLGELLAAVVKDPIPASEALRVSDRAFETFRRVSLSGADDAFALRALQGLGESYEVLSSFAQAAAAYSEALESARRLGDRSAQASLLWRRGRVHRKRNRWTEALDSVSEARRIYEDLGDGAGTARCRISEGVLAFERGDYDSAGAAYRQALEAAEHIDDRRIMADAANNLGILATIRGDFDQAIGHYRNSLALYEQLQRTGPAAQAHHNLGICHASRRNWTQALEAFEQSLESSQKLGNLWQTGMTLVHKAAVFIELGDSDVAASYCARAIEIFREIDYPLGSAEAYKVLGRLFTHRQDWTTARSLLQESLRICEAYENPLGTAEAHRELGQLYARRGDADEARASLTEASEAFERLGASHDLELTQDLLSEVRR